MERLPLFLVFGTTMCLLVHSHEDCNSLETLYYNKYTVRVKGDEVVGKKGFPTIYHWLEMKSYNLTECEFSLEAVATGNLICMKSQGKVYTVNPDKLSKLQSSKRFRRFDQIRGAKTPPKDCLFKRSKPFPNTYANYSGIYSFAHSTPTEGLFLVVSHKGKVRGARRPFNELENGARINERVKMHFVTVKSRELLQHLHKTNFTKNHKHKHEKFNERVRKCIERNAELFKHTRRTPKERHVKRLLRKVVPKCKKRIEKRINLEINETQ